MSNLSPGDEDLHDPADDTLHRWWPEGPPDENLDREWIARAIAHANAHAARASAPVIDEDLEHEER